MSFMNKRIQFMRPRKNGRNPSNYPTDGVGMPLRITRLFPLKLKEVTLDKLQTKDKERDVYCITEMMNLFDCFEKNDFDRTTCKQHVLALEHCVTSHKNKAKNK